MTVRALRLMHVDVRTVIEATGLALTFETNDGPVHALSDVNLTIGQGDFISFIGPSGCGKTTLLRMMTGLAEASGMVGAMAGNMLLAYCLQLINWRTCFIHAAIYTLFLTLIKLYNCVWLLYLPSFQCSITTVMIATI